jgi:hypothetical protein
VPLAYCRSSSCRGDGTTRAAASVDLELQLQPPAGQHYRDVCKAGEGRDKVCLVVRNNQDDVQLRQTHSLDFPLNTSILGELDFWPRGLLGFGDPSTRVFILLVVSWNRPMPSLNLSVPTKAEA